MKVSAVFSYEIPGKARGRSRGYAALMTWTPVASFHNELEALLAKGALEAAAIPCRARLSAGGDALLGGFGVANGPTELLVEEKYLKKAKEVLGKQNQ
jgi:hypothetical protein